MKIIFHIDLDAYFASVEEIYNPSLKNVPFVIANEGTHSVISTANYHARKYGVKSAMNINIAKRLCPQIVVVKPHHHLYEEVSQKFFDLLIYKFTNDVEVLSIDECFMDVTPLLEKYHNNFYLLALTIQKEVEQRLGLSISIGISENKFLAKMATDIKKPHGITTLFANEIPEKLYPLPIDKFVGIGKKTIPLLNNLEIFTIKDFVESKKTYELEKILGKKYHEFLKKATGESEDTLDFDWDIPKSIGKSITFNQNEFEIDVILNHLKNLCEEVTQELDSYRMIFKTLTIQIRYDNFSTKSKSKTFNVYIDNFQSMLSFAKNLFFDLWNEEPIRLIGVYTSRLIFID